MSRKKSKG